MYSDWKDQVLPPVKTKPIQVYEVDSDRGTYWESNPFVPEIWESGIVEEDPWPAIKALSEAGYEVHVKSHAAYLEWLKTHEEGYFEMEEPHNRWAQPHQRGEE